MTAISDYFRTALLIDDRVEADYGELEELDIGQAKEFSGEPVGGLDDPSKNDETPVRPSNLVSAFLAKNIVCGVLKPHESDDLADLAVKGAQTADVLIIDWLLFGDDSATVDAIKTIAEAHKDRLTVIVVFTGVLSLGEVVDRLIEAANFDEPYDFVLKSDNTVVLVFGKPGITLTGGEDRRTANYRELPGMIRDDLEMVFKGLTPEFAFQGINALRDSAPRVLATFNSELDAGALTHRALLSEPADAGTQFVRLLVSEFEQILNERHVGEIWSIDSSIDSVARMVSEGNPDMLAAKLHKSPNVRADLKELSSEELALRVITDGLASTGLGDSAVSGASGVLSGAFADGETSNETLAILMSSSGLGEIAPRLELGVVLRDKDGSYWLCVQPLCDSVRLTEKRAFPMLPLSINPQEPAAMFRSPEGEPVIVGFEKSPHKLVMPEFEPGDAGAVAAQGEPSKWSFTCVDGARCEAVARLRPEVAAQAVHGLASSASRPGTDSSEWLRRGAPQQR